jgi:hypothetical protein
MATSDLGRFVPWQDLGDDRVDAELPGDAGGFVVAGEHGYFDPCFVQG